MELVKGQAYIENPQVGDEFQFEGINETWVITKVYMLDGKPGLREFMVSRGHNASLTVRRKNGKTLHDLGHYTDNTASYSKLVSWKGM